MSAINNANSFFFIIIPLNIIIKNYTVLFITTYILLMIMVTINPPASNPANARITVTVQSVDSPGTVMVVVRVTDWGTVVVAVVPACVEVSVEE
jgi:hypothetical protein